MRMLSGCVPSEIFQAHSTGRVTCGRPITHWRYYDSSLAWECLGITQKEMEGVTRVSDPSIPPGPVTTLTPPKSMVEDVLDVRLVG